MKLIAATLGYSVKVDDADYGYLSQFKWYAHNSGGKIRTEKRPARRTSVAEGRKVISLVHHLIKPPQGFVVDHINGDPWDNRRENLRVCTHAENLRNRKKHSGETTNPYKGVFPRSRRWLVLIMCDGRRYDLGSYASAEEAARAYDDAALFLHGRFARLNFTDGRAVARSPSEVKSGRPMTLGRDWSALVEAVKSGEPATMVAQRAGVSPSGLCKAARAAGVPLRRGRPTLEAVAMRAAA